MLDENICAAVPTSIEMLQRMIVTGRLVDRSPFSDNYSNNSLIAFPTPSMIPSLNDFEISKGITDVLYDQEFLREACEAQAASIAQTHYFLFQLGMTLENPQLNGTVFDYLHSSDPDHKRIQELLTGSLESLSEQEIGYSSELFPYTPLDSLHRIAAVTEKARERKGFIVGIYRWY